MTAEGKDMRNNRRSALHHEMSLKDAERHAISEGGEAAAMALVLLQREERNISHPASKPFHCFKTTLLPSTYCSGSSS